MSTTDRTDVELRIADLRPLLTQALHAVLPDVPLIDCAVAANTVLDEAEQGNLDLVRVARTFLDGVLATAKMAH